jgi:ketosteroid isomerase-like protein
MSQEDVEAARRATEAFNRTLADGGDDYYDFLDAEIEWAPITVFLDGATYRGLDQVRKWVDDLRRDWETYEVTWDEIRDLGAGRVLAFGSWHARGRRSGLETGFQHAAWLIQLRDGKQLRMQTFIDRKKALEAAGLRE